MNKKLLVISGPTGIGKTETCFKLQEEFGCKIISADSRQIYKEISIGTAKPSQDEIKLFNIKLVDHVSIFTPYNAGRFEQEALHEIKDDFNVNGVSIMGGGTGLYVQAVCQGLNEFPNVDEEITNHYNYLFQTKGIENLQKELKVKDPEYFEKVDQSNSRRIIRALSVIKASQKTYSYFVNQPLPKRDFECFHIVLNINRESLYQKINSRVDKMITKGLLDEAREVFEFKHLKSLQTVGYQELFEYFNGNISNLEAIEKIKMNSRRYAKRQLTWLNKYIAGPRFNPKDFDKILEHFSQNMQN